MTNVVVGTALTSAGCEGAAASPDHLEQIELRMRRETGNLHHLAVHQENGSSTKGRSFLKSIIFAPAFSGASRGASMHQDPDEALATLIPALDNLRKNWFSQVLARCSGTHPIVNKTFTHEIDLGIPEENLPGTFPFNRFDGEAAEALILNWQLQVAINFSEQRGYLELNEFIGSMMKNGKNDSLWLRTLGSFFSSEFLKPEHASLHLAQYLLGSAEQTEPVQALGEELSGFLYILTLATQGAAAQSFGDNQEAARCTAAISALATPENQSDTPGSVRRIVQRPWRAVALAIFIVGGIFLVSRQTQRQQDTPVREIEAPQLVLQPATAASGTTAISQIDAQPAPAKNSLLEPITDPEIAANLTRQIRRESLDRDPIVVISLDGEKAWINLRGTNVELPLAALEGVSDNTNVANSFSRRFAKNNLSLRIKYEVLSSSTNQEMGCTRTEYRISIKVSSSQGTEHIEPESYGEGC